MKIKWILLITMMISGMLYAQTTYLQDDFEDGNLDGWSQNEPGAWAASDSLPINGNYSMRHNMVDTSGHSYLYSSLNGLDVDSGETVWRFNIKTGSYDPDNVRKFWAYLMVHDTTDVDGYALGVNLSGQSDTLTLWKMTGSSADGIVIQSTFNWDASELVGLQVTRNSLGLWQLHYDTTGNFDNLTSAGSAINSDYKQANYFGLSYYFKTAEAGAFWMDDLLVQQNSEVIVDTKLFLEGPFEADSMYTHLNQDGVIPSSQPYNAEPWTYTGLEKTSTIPKEVVDWVLLELRNGSDSTSRVARRAGFLRKDGRIVDLDGANPVSFAPVDSGDYYIVIQHRNHLAVMSAQPQTLSMSTTLYDFSTSADQAYGFEPMKELNGSVYGLYAGDANGNGQVQTDDKNEIWSNEVGLAGYKDSDFNLNGQVQTDDKNNLWKVNVGKGTQVP